MKIELWLKISGKYEHIVIDLTNNLNVFLNGEKL